ncbi:MAG: MSMEG_0568 family radical SAM protein [Candidatus Helarchaeota archaeon]
MKLDLVKLKLRLLTEGVTLKTQISKGRKFGAGPAGGRFFILENGSCVNIPLWPKFVKHSGLSLEKNEDKDNLYNLIENETQITTLKIVPRPNFYDLFTSDNIQMNKIAMLHGKDCLASTVYQKCIYWSQGKPCAFCGIELSLQAGSTTLQKTGKQLSEVLDASIKEGICNHLTLTTGTPNLSDKGAKMYTSILKEIKKDFDVPIHVQLEPPNNKVFIEKLYSSGADTIGIHIETFDPSIFLKICPGKSKIGFDKYKQIWEYCVKIFGTNQVSSYILLGIGESLTSIRKGSQYLIENGIVPYIVQIRPILGTTFENFQPIHSSIIYDFYRIIKKYMTKYNLKPHENKAGCVRCGACSIISDELH